MHHKSFLSCLLIFVQLIFIQSLAPAQTALEESNHVIILIDRSGSIDKSIDSLEHTFKKKLGEILFKGIDELPALYRTKQDEISILFFGIRYGAQFSKDYIHTYLMHSRNFTDADLSILYEQYRNHLFQSFSQGRYWTALSVAPYYGLYKSRSNTTKYQKTYLIMLTDGQFNDQPERELDYLKENSDSRIEETDEAKKICLDIKNLYDIQFRGQREVGKLKLTVYEVAVRYLPRELIHKLPNEIELKRQASLYTAIQEISTVESQSISSPHDKYELLQITYQIVDASDAYRHVQVQDKKVIDANEPHVIDIQLSSGHKSNENLVVKVKYSFLFADNYYGNQIVETQDEIKIGFEPTQQIWGFIPIPNTLMSLHDGKSQAEIKRIYNLVGVILLVIAGMLIVWLIIRPKILPDWEFSPTPSDVTLNFNESNHGRVQIGTVRLFNRARAWYKLKGSFRANLAATAEMPNYLVTSEENFLSLGTSENHSISNLQVVQEANIEVYADLNVIDDCKDLSVTEAEIPFTLATEMKARRKDDFIDKKDDLIVLRLVPEVQKLDFDLVINQKTIEHRREEKPIFGQLNIANKVQKIYSESLNASFCLVLPGKSNEFNNGIFFEIPASFDDGKIKHLNDAPSTILIRNLQKGETVPLNLGLDFSIIPDPKSVSDVYQCQIHNIDDEGNLLRQRGESWALTILKDSTLPDLLIKIRRDKKEIYKFEGETNQPEAISIEKICAIDAIQNEICEFIIGNSAKSGDGYILIDGEVSKIHLIDSPLTREEELTRLFDQNFSADSTNDTSGLYEEESNPFERLLVLGEYEKLRDWSISNKQIINNTPPESVKIYARIPPEEDLPDEVSFDIEFRFNYKLCDSNGQTTEENELILPLKLTLKRDLGGYWLSLDYGTSAIACAFDNSTTNPKLIDLQRRFLENEGPTENSQAGTPFIRSTMMLTPGEKAGELDFVDLEFLDSTLALYPERLVPYLKKIIGYDRVPLPKPLSYLDSDGNRIENKPLLIDVLTSLYRKIVEDYIQHSIRTEEKGYLNKIIIAISNTFTPNHIDLLRGIVREHFEEFKEIDFISESDAVACYYIDNWPRLNQKRSESRREFLAANDEYILVYDAGAGTIDLTYLKIHKDDTGTTQIEVLNKLGKSSGGNNLDTILARIIDEKLREIEEEEELIEVRFSGLYPEPDEDIIDHKNAMINFKREIRDNLKLEYSKWDGSNPEQTIKVKVDDVVLGREFLEITCDEIANYSEIQKFITDNTEVLFEQFFEPMGYNPKKLPLIDTVILSGRTTLFPQMKESVQKAIEKWANANRHEPYYPTLAEDELKSAVCLGALAYAITWRFHESIRFVDRNIWAKYGALHRDGAGEWHFTEFISPDPNKTSPINTRNIEGKIINEYEVSKTIDFTHTDKIRFIQTYSNDPAKDFSEGNYGLITFLHEANKNAFPFNELELTVKIDGENKLTLEIQGNVWKVDLNYVDLEKDNAYKEGLWPLL